MCFDHLTLVSFLIHTTFSGVNTMGVKKNGRSFFATNPPPIMNLTFLIVCTLKVHTHVLCVEVVRQSDVLSTNKSWFFKNWNCRENENLCWIFERPGKKFLTFLIFDVQKYFTPFWNWHTIVYKFCFMRFWPFFPPSGLKLQKRKITQQEAVGLYAALAAQIGRRYFAWRGNF